MYIHKQIVIIAAPAEKVFEYLTTPSNFPLWLKDVWLAGKKIGKMGIGCSLIQTIRLINPRKFNMKVTGYVENKYFRIQALKGSPLLPGYVFSLKQCKSGQTELTVYVEIRSKWETGNVNNLKKFALFYPGGVAEHWKLYLRLLEKGVVKRVEKIN
jgi:hypothetical protein